MERLLLVWVSDRWNQLPNHQQPGRHAGSKTLYFKIKAKVKLNKTKSSQDSVLNCDSLPVAAQIKPQNHHRVVL